MDDKEFEIDYILWQLSDLIEIITDDKLIEKLFEFKHEIIDIKLGGNYDERVIQKFKK